MQHRWIEELYWFEQLTCHVSNGIKTGATKIVQGVKLVSGIQVGNHSISMKQKVRHTQEEWHEAGEGDRTVRIKLQVRWC